MLSVYGDFWLQIDIMMFFYWEIFCEFLELVWYNDQGDFWAYPIEILVCANPTEDMSTSSSLPLLIWVILCKSNANLWVIFCSLELQPIISQPQPVHL